MNKQNTLRGFVNAKNQKEIIDKANNKLFPEFSKILKNDSKKDIFERRNKKIKN
tara:strand:- start:1347 stop:1508 length:162 start_codon:yes stop_codon:yes gene_type:complete